MGALQKAARPQRLGLGSGLMDRRARAAPGRVGGVVRQPSHGRHSRPIRIISVHLLDAAGRLLLVLFLDHQAARLATSKWPHLSSAALRAPR